MSSQDQKSEESSRNEPSKTSQGVVADWLIVFAKVYRLDPLPEEIVVAFRTIEGELRDVTIAHRAFARALRECKFCPVPADVIEAYNVELDLASFRKTKKLEEPPRDPMTPVELVEYNEKMNALRKTLGLGPRAISSDSEIEQRRQQLVLQAEQIRERFPRGRR